MMLKTELVSFSKTKKRQDKILVVAHAHETMQHTSYYMHSNRDLHLEKSDK